MFCRGLYKFFTTHQVLRVFHRMSWFSDGAQAPGGCRCLRLVSIMTWPPFAFLDKAHQKQAKAYNKARQEGVNPYQVGERVLTLRPREKLQGKDKLGTVWEGPFTI